MREEGMGEEIEILRGNFTLEIINLGFPHFMVKVM